MLNTNEESESRESILETHVEEQDSNSQPVVAQEDLEVVLKMLEAKDACNVDRIHNSRLNMKSHRKKIKFRSVNNKYDICSTNALSNASK